MHMPRFSHSHNCRLGVMVWLTPEPLELRTAGLNRTACFNTSAKGTWQNLCTECHSGLVSGQKAANLKHAQKRGDSWPCLINLLMWSDRFSTAMHWANAHDVHMAMGPLYANLRTDWLLTCFCYRAGLTLTQKKDIQSCHHSFEQTTESKINLNS